MGGIVSGIVGGIGGILSGGAASKAASEQAAAQRAAAQRASQMAQFRPVGLTTGFGSSRFNVNDLGQVTEAGYSLNPQLQAIRDRLLSGAAGYDPTELGQLTTPALATGVSSLFNLGQGYLAESPQEAAQRFVQQQQALLAPSRQAQLSNVRSNLFARGRGGLGVQTGTGSAPTSPELQAYYNALGQQDLALAAQGQQAGMEQARFGTGLLTGASELARQIPALQSAGYAPLQTQLGLASTVESLGQQPFLLSQDLARMQAAAGAQAGGMYQSGMNQAAATQARADAYSPLGSFLSGAGSGIGGLGGGGGGFGGLFSGGLGGINPFNRYGSGMFDWGTVPTSVNRSWNSME
jgi:hypothetical protein